MLYELACQQARAISSSSVLQPDTPAHWQATLPQRRKQWLEMLGLLPLPERTPLEATVTGTLDRGDYVVEKVHFQSLPGAHVVGNLYRPAKITEPLPAVLYLCGHSIGKVSPYYQADPRWFGQHGYVALVLDPIQLGECQGYHHGTYLKERWDWISRGYTPAGTEVWNGMRALDYLQERDDVDEQRMGVTGLSGGGAISWFLGAADERTKVVVPVCQTGTIEHIVSDRATDGHCDCAFWINYQRWCTPDLGALIAPRALLVASGTEDVLWRPYGFRDALHRIRRQYEALGIGDKAALVEDLTPHGYTPKLREAIFSWFNKHLKGDATPVTEGVTDYAEPTENLLVFGGKLPENDRMGVVDTLLVKQAELPPLSTPKAWELHQRDALAHLRGLTFQYTVSEAPPRLLEQRNDGSADGPDKVQRTFYWSAALQTDDGVTVRLHRSTHSQAAPTAPIVVWTLAEDARSAFCGGGGPGATPDYSAVAVEVRNTGATSVGPGYLWTLRRTYPLLGQSLPERQVHDLLAAVEGLRAQRACGPVVYYGQGPRASLALYAALLDDQAAELVLDAPPETHCDPQTPEFPGILRRGDLPHNLALLCPLPITFIGVMPEAYAWTQQVYELAGFGDRIRVVESLADWRPSAPAS